MFSLLYLQVKFHVYINSRLAYKLHSSVFSVVPLGYVLCVRIPSLTTDYTGVCCVLPLGYVFCVTFRLCSLLK